MRTLWKPVELAGGERGHLARRDVDRGESREVGVRLNAQGGRRDLHPGVGGVEDAVLLEHTVGALADREPPLIGGRRCRQRHRVAATLRPLELLRAAHDDPATGGRHGGTDDRLAPGAERGDVDHLDRAGGDREPL